MLIKKGALFLLCGTFIMSSLQAMDAAPLGWLSRLKMSAAGLASLSLVPVSKWLAEKKEYYEGNRLSLPPLSTDKKPAPKNRYVALLQGISKYALHGAIANAGLMGARIFIQNAYKGTKIKSPRVYLPSFYLGMAGGALIGAASFYGEYFGYKYTWAGSLLTGTATSWKAMSDLGETLNGSEK